MTVPSKIHVLRVITWLPVGGIERKIVDVLPRLDQSRFEVSLVCIRERGPLADELEAAGVPVEVIPFRSRLDMRGLRQLADLMRRKKIDVVHSHMYRSNVAATIAARMAGVKRVWAQIHNVDTWETRRQLWMDRFLCRWRDGIIAVSEEVRRDAIYHLRIPPDKVRVLYNGVDLSRFGRESAQGAKAREELRAQEGVAAGEVVFLMAARMVEQKRPQDFIDLADYLFKADRRGKKFPDVHFWILGDGPLLEVMKKRAAAASRPDRIKFFGRRDDVERYMAAADMFIMTSTKEGFSNALLEAMASGLVPVVTDVGGNAEAVRECTDGRVIPAMQFHKLCSAVDRVLGDAKYREELSASAARRAGEFSLEAMVKNVEDLYSPIERVG
ncbi:glycosyltransferase [Candidatus Sumerlaeota bacterium]|nr:glycosyltransferase [Candidatus Sumerlaeota bacterium]MBI3736247.1 glycosyltransferase [Candidatus Sumerlaeota bacterium]